MFRLTFFPVHWFFLLLAINGIAPSFSQTVCDDSAVERCTEVMNTVINNPKLAFPENDDDIETSCRYFNQYVDCVKKTANDCYKAEAKTAFLGVFSGVISLLDDICTRGSPYRAKLLKHGPCFRSVENELQDCVNKYTAEGKKLKTAKMSNEETLEKTCCYMDATTDCITAPVMENCGKEAVDLVKQAAEKIYGPVAVICSSVDHDSSTCSAASSVTISGLLFFILMIIMNLKQ